MTAKQKFFSFLLSIVIAIVPVLLMENIAYLRNTETYVLGLFQQTVQAVQHYGSGKDKGKIIAILFILLSLLYLLLYICFFELLAAIYLAISSKRRKPAIFISFKIPESKDDADTAAIAITIKKYLVERGFRVNIQEPLSRPKHDLLNQDIKQLLNQSDALLAIPHINKSSYVDAEIATAYHNDKPVYIIKYDPAQILPATANSGHIVFNLAKLKTAGYMPLNIILPYINSYWKSRIKIMELPLDKLDPGGKFPFNVFGFYLLAFGLSLLIGINVSINITLLKFPMEILITILGFYSALVTMNHIYKNINLQKAARQSAISNRPTYELLEQAGFDKSVLGSIDHVGLKLKKK